MRRAASVALAACALALAGCGGMGGPGGEQGKILDVMDKGRDALLANRAADVCALLTDHGRARSLGFAVDFAGGPAAGRCEQVVDIESRSDDPADQLSSWRHALKSLDFTVEEVRGDRATVTLGGGIYEPKLHFTLVRTPDGWRIDDSSDVPGGQ